MNHSYYQKWQSQEHTNVQIKVNIPFLYFAAFNRQCRCFIVNTVFDFSQTFRGVNTDFFFNFSDIFLISPTSDPSDFLLNRAVWKAIDEYVTKRVIHIWLAKRFVVKIIVERCDEFLAQFRKFLIGWNP